MPDPKVSYFKNGMLGFHLTLNPAPALTPTARVYRRFLQNGIRLNDRELQSLLAGRDQGIATIDRLLGGVAGPSLGGPARLQISTEIADAIFARGLDAHLSREAPTLLEQSEERGARLQQLLDPQSGDVGMADRLLRSVPPIGLSLTIHFR
jgi:hypothetical protein